MEFDLIPVERSSDEQHRSDESNMISKSSDRQNAADRKEILEKSNTLHQFGNDCRYVDSLFYFTQSQ
jgi:hypothetical protein